MRCVQLPAAAAIGVLLSEEGFGHIRFSPNYPVGNPSRTQMGVSRLFSEAFGGEGSTKTFTRYKLPSYYRAYKTILFVDRHIGVRAHATARRSELAYRSRQCRQLVAHEV